MKLLSYTREAVLLGDDAADGLMAYASRLSSLGLTNIVELRVLTLSGEPADASFMLTPGAPLMALSHTCEYQEPDNAERVAVMLADALGRDTATLLPPVPGEDLIFGDMDFNALFDHGPA
jgi:hypothetical protein